MDDNSLMPFGSKKDMKLGDINDGYLLKLYDRQADRLPADLKAYIEDRIPVLRHHTSHPQLISYLQKSNKWVLKSQQMFGGNKAKSKQSIMKAGLKKGIAAGDVIGGGSGFGGHFLAVHGYKYLGERK